MQPRSRLSGDHGKSAHRHELFSRLSHTDQEIIRLTYWDGLTQKQAAQVLGMPEGTLRSRHHRARESLRRMLAEGLAKRTLNVRTSADPVTGSPPRTANGDT